MKPTIRERWTLLIYALERWGWFTRWLFQCGRAFHNYRRYSRKVVVKTTVEVERPQAVARAEVEVLPPPGTPPKPRHVGQSQELVESVATALYGVRNPAKKLRNVKLLVNYEDGTNDSWSCEHQVGVHMEHDSRTSTITLTSLEA